MAMTKKNQVELLGMTNTTIKIYNLMDSLQCRLDLVSCF